MIKKVFAIIYKLYKVVYYIHSYGIVNRDIKPVNVLLSSESEDVDIRLLDFDPKQKNNKIYEYYCFDAINGNVELIYLDEIDVEDVN